jgi:hypothetical protein
MLPDDQPDNDPSESGHNNVAREHKRQEETPPQFAPRTKRRKLWPDGPLGETIGVPALCHVGCEVHPCFGITVGQVRGHKRTLSSLESRPRFRSA